MTITVHGHGCMVFCLSALTICNQLYQAAFVWIGATLSLSYIVLEWDLHSPKMVHPPTSFIQNFRLSRHTRSEQRCCRRQPKQCQHLLPYYFHATVRVVCCWTCICSTRCVNPLKPTAPICYTLPYMPNPPFLISDIRALWRSGLSARVPECQKLKMVG